MPLVAVALFFGHADPVRMADRAVRDPLCRAVHARRGPAPLRRLRSLPDVVDLYQVLVGAWLYLTPVIHPREIVPHRFQWLLALEPDDVVRRRVPSAHL